MWSLLQPGEPYLLQWWLPHARVSRKDDEEGEGTLCRKDAIACLVRPNFVRPKSDDNAHRVRNRLWSVWYRLRDPIDPALPCRWIGSSIDRSRSGRVRGRVHTVRPLCIEPDCHASVRRLGRRAAVQAYGRWGAVLAVRATPPVPLAVAEWSPPGRTRERERQPARAAHAYARRLVGAAPDLLGNLGRPT